VGSAEAKQVIKNVREGPRKIDTINFILVHPSSRAMPSLLLPH